jgi:predicted metal-dependent HD superfamily phosphohydrolase
VDAERRWLEFLDSLVRASGLPAGSARAADGAPEVYLELDRRYREPHRHYHAWPHILACLGELEAARPLSPHPQALELAIWFHDAMYEPGAPDNEDKSARLARAAAGRLGLPGALAAEAGALILVTRHLGGEPDSPGACREDMALMLDIDLAVFGQPWEAFAAYEEGIGREYQAMPPELHRERRKRILQSFLDRPHIYLTGAFRDRYEEKARENLRLSIARLG